MCCTRLAEIQDAKITQKSPSAHYRTTLLGYISSQLRHVSTIEKNLLNSNISYTCPHNIVNVGPLTSEIGWRVLGTSVNFNGSRVLASLLHCRRSTYFNHTLHHVLPSPGLVHYIHFWRRLSPNGILPGAKFTLRSSLALSYAGSVAALHSSSGRQPNFATGWPSRSTLGGRTVYMDLFSACFLFDVASHSWKPVTGSPCQQCGPGRVGSVHGSVFHIRWFDPIFGSQMSTSLRRQPTTQTAFSVSSRYITAYK